MLAPLSDEAHAAESHATESKSLEGRAAEGLRRGFRVSALARVDPLADFHPGEIPPDEAHEADYIKSLPPLTTAKIGGGLRVAPKGWRKEPMLQALAELCRRQGERSTAAMAKITDRLSEVYLDGQDELVRDVVAEAAVRFMREPANGKYAPSHVLLGHLKNSTGSGAPAVAPRRKKVEF